ncbi:MAG: hypothetical protein ABI921_00560 [Panacibacter sp.]
MTNQATIPPGSGMLEIKGVPTALILYAVQQWLPCGDYVSGGAMPKNTNIFIKAISVWLILKSETSSGKIKDYRTQLQQLAVKCKCSTRTLEKYINWLRKERLATVTDQHLLLENYKPLRKLGINIYQREQTIYYDTTNNVQLSEILISIAMIHYKERWMKMYWKKMQQNPDKYNELYNLLVNCNADKSQLANPAYFRQCHLELMLQSFEEESGHSYDFQFLHNYINANPDLNARASTYALKFNYGHAMSFVHLKLRLKKKGLIEVWKGHVEGQERAHKDDKLFHTGWNKHNKQTVWYRCDQVEILAANFFTKKPAA